MRGCHSASSGRRDTVAWQAGWANIVTCGWSRKDLGCPGRPSERLRDAFLLAPEYRQGALRELLLGAGLCCPTIGPAAREPLPILIHLFRSSTRNRQQKRASFMQDFH